MPVSPMRLKPYESEFKQEIEPIVEKAPPKTTIIVAAYTEYRIRVKGGIARAILMVQTKKPTN